MKKIIKRIGIIIGILLCIVSVLALCVLANTQLVVGAIQKMMYGNGSPNSYEPLYEAMEGYTDEGLYKISEIAYGDTYPNSYLDILYCGQDDAPTLFYFHGGGFFGGSKNMGDPMAANESTALLDDICKSGFNIVNVDYALVPDYHFPVPLVQMNEAIGFIIEHKDEYKLDMDEIVIMGSSAGAIMTAQYGAVLSNEEYAKLLDIEPAVSVNNIRAVVVDDAPLIYKEMNVACKILIGNYIKGSIFLSEEEIDSYECTRYINGSYPDAILLGSEYRSDMEEMTKQLRANGINYEFVDPYTEYGKVMPHCFVANERVDEIAAEAFERLLAFIK